MKCISIKSKAVYAIVLLSLLTACSNTSPLPTTTVMPTIAPSLTPFIPSITATHIPTNTIDVTPEPNISSSCNIVDKDGKLYILSDDVIFAWETSEEEIDTALEDDFPEWIAYRQKVEWDANPIKIGEIIINASWQERFVINPSITLVTLGESFNWQIPSDKDLYLESQTINERLNHLWFEWTSPDNEDIRNIYPDISNASTYALYIFFNQNTEKLESWCNTYQLLFGASR